MATFFGEVVSAHSRAVDEEEEDDTLTPRVNVIRHDPDFICKNLKCVVFTCSAATYVFARTQLLGLTSKGGITAKKLLTVESESGNEEAVTGEEEFQSGLKYTRATRILSNLYVSTEIEGVLICTCEESVWDDEYQPLAIEKIFEFMNIDKNTSVVVLASENWTYFKHSENSPTVFPMLRCLKTSEASKISVNVRRLEQPNIVSGFAASVMTCCEIKKIAAVAYICYESTSDSSTMDALMPTMFMWPLQDLHFPGSQENMVSKVRDTGNLYT